MVNPVVLPILILSPYSHVCSLFTCIPSPQPSMYALSVISYQRWIIGPQWQGKLKLRPWESPAEKGLDLTDHFWELNFKAAKWIYTINAFSLSLISPPSVTWVQFPRIIFFQTSLDFFPLAPNSITLQVQQQPHRQPCFWERDKRIQLLRARFAKTSDFRCFFQGA